jgi:laccase
MATINYTRNCVEKPLLAINGQYPGPIVEVTEGDRVVVKVINAGNYNLTIHW